jgi:hypothetical protein
MVLPHHPRGQHVIPHGIQTERAGHGDLYGLVLGEHVREFSAGLANPNFAPFLA